MSLRTPAEPATGGSPGDAASASRTAGATGVSRGTLRRPKLLVATDGSGAALWAGEYGVRLAKRLGAKLYVLNVVDTHFTFPGAAYYGRVVTVPAMTGREATGEIGAMAARAGVECEERMVEGGPAREIVGEAEETDADFVVPGREKKPRLESVLFDSVVQEVLWFSGRPVLVTGAEHSPVSRPEDQQVLETR